MTHSSWRHKDAAAEIVRLVRSGTLVSEASIAEEVMTVLNRIAPPENRVSSTRTCPRCGGTSWGDTDADPEPACVKCRWRGTTDCDEPRELLSKWNKEADALPQSRKRRALESCIGELNSWIEQRDPTVCDPERGKHRRDCPRYMYDLENDGLPSCLKK